MPKIWQSYIESPTVRFNLYFSIKEIKHDWPHSKERFVESFFGTKNHTIPRKSQIISLQVVRMVFF